MSADCQEWTTTTYVARFADADRALAVADAQIKRWQPLLDRLADE
ncbi:hypothetical protein GCM10023197_18170 [Gordonia humi]|uniref:Uncharacterized protein n=1 Tax=Gordonia humi TaxID=686429 RepID=A0A840ESV9_9ACTN|nr:hypothetical protein [Gordonia humi]